MAKYTLSSSRVSRLVRALVALLVVSTAVGPVPLAAASKVSPTTMDTPVVESPPPPPAPVVTVNRTAPKVSPVPTTLTFSSRPTEAELSRARVFAEPLLPIGATNAAENRALATALVAFVGSEPRDRTTWPLARFLADHPRSAWRLRCSRILGPSTPSAGAMTKAFAAWDEAWLGARELEGAAAEAIGAQAVGEWLDLKTQLGLVDQAEDRLRNLALGGLSGLDRARAPGRERVPRC